MPSGQAPPLDAVAAIDFHTHAEVSRTGADGLTPELRRAAAVCFGEATLPTADERPTAVVPDLAALLELLGEGPGKV